MNGLYRNTFQLQTGCNVIPFRIGEVVMSYLLGSVRLFPVIRLTKDGAQFHSLSTAPMKYRLRWPRCRCDTDCGSWQPHSETSYSAVMPPLQWSVLRQTISHRPVSKPEFCEAKKLRSHHCISISEKYYAVLAKGARCSSVVRAFAHGAIGRRIDPSWWTH